MKVFPKILCALLALMLFSNPAFADIDDLVEAIESANSSSSSSESKEHSSSSSSSSSSTSSSSYSRSSSSHGSDLLTVWLFEEALYLWEANNFFTRFEPYPYAYDDRYVNLDTTYRTDTRSFRFSVDTQLGYQWGLGAVAEQHFEGFLFKFFGPYASNYTCIDSGGKLTGFTELGGQIAITQSTPLSMYMFIDWVHWYGEAGGALGSDGATVGFILRSFPFEPIAVDFKVSWQGFEVNAEILNMQLDLGFFTERHEHYLGWRHTDIRDSQGNPVKAFDGIVLGHRIYF